MERTVEIGAGVGQPLNLADVKLRSGRITFPRRFAAEEVADERRGNTFVGNHPVLDGVT